MRPEKESADFRGTTIYASSFVHEGFDQCPRDDLISVLHVFFDMIIGKLPWSDAARSKCKPAAVAMKLNMYRNPDEFIAWLCEEVSSKVVTILFGFVSGFLLTENVFLLFSLKSAAGFEGNFSLVTRTISLEIIKYLSVGLLSSSSSPF